MFHTKMFSYGGRGILVLVYVLMQTQPRVCVTQVTFKLIMNKGLLVNNRRFDLARFEMSFDLLTNTVTNVGCTVTCIFWLRFLSCVTETNTYRAFLPFTTPIRKIGIFRMGVLKGENAR